MREHLFVLGALRIDIERSNNGHPPDGTVLIHTVHAWGKYPQRLDPRPLLVSLNEQSSFGDINERYNISKLLDVFITREIAKLPASVSGDVVVNTVTPGTSYPHLSYTSYPCLHRHLNVYQKRSPTPSLVFHHHHQLPYHNDPIVPFPPISRYHLRWHPLTPQASVNLDSETTSAHSSPL